MWYYTQTSRFVIEYTNLSLDLSDIIFNTFIFYEM